MQKANHVSETTAILPPKSSAAVSPSHLALLVALLVALCHDMQTTFRIVTNSRPTPHETHRINIDSSPHSIPPIETLIAENGTIIGDISWMLDFAIVAFPKSGTTFMKDYLRQSSQVWMHDREFCMKNAEDVRRFVRVYHDARLGQIQTREQQQNDGNASMIRYGLKCPGVLYRNDIELYRTYFHRTKLIVGIRHPVSWFESFYNYQMYRNVTTLTTTTTDLVGRCGKHQKVCTDRARFHAALARLGLTTMESEEELSLLFGWRYENRTNVNGRQKKHQHRRRLQELGQEQLVDKTQRMGVHVSSNQVFLYEIRQIHNAFTAKELSKNIQQYLQLSEALPEIASYIQNKTRAINICDHEHDAVRRVLVEHGRDAADWIERYFVKSSNVFVSSPESFFNLLNDWRRDPCPENSFD
ncbi:hypothetical protein ACHAW6_000746 [Cyclotella cf. meneghiniana]